LRAQLRREKHRSEEHGPDQVPHELAD